MFYLSEGWTWFSMSFEKGFPGSNPSFCVGLCKVQCLSAFQLIECILHYWYLQSYTSFHSLLNSKPVVYVRKVDGKAKGFGLIGNNTPIWFWYHFLGSKIHLDRSCLVSNLITKMEEKLKHHYLCKSNKWNLLVLTGLCNSKGLIRLALGLSLEYFKIVFQGF